MDECRPLVCDSVDVYGVGLSTCAGISDTNCIGGNAWHYWQADDFHDSREFSEVGGTEKFKPIFLFST